MLALPDSEWCEYRHKTPRAASNAMFNPSKDDVRRFFCDTWRKHREGAVLSPLEAVALDWMLKHPEYHGEFDDLDAALAREYEIDDGRTNPFLHHVDAPGDRRATFDRSAARHPSRFPTNWSARRGDEHAAMHDVMECLGEAVWSAQRAGQALPADEMSARYLDCLKRRAARASMTASASGCSSGPGQAPKYAATFRMSVARQWLRDAVHDRVLAGAALVVAQHLFKVVLILAGEFRIGRIDPVTKSLP